MIYYIIIVATLFLIKIITTVVEIRKERIHEARVRLVCREGYVPRTVHFFPHLNLTKGGFGAAYINLLLMVDRNERPKPTAK